MCCVKTEEGYADFFKVISGVQQGCILSPFFFLILLDFVLKNSLDQSDKGIAWNDGKLADLDFADDLALLSDKMQEMQELTSSLVNLAEKVGLRVNIGKTKIQKVACNEARNIQIKGENLVEVETFSYLGSGITSNGDVLYDVNCRIGKGAAAFNKLDRIWKTNKIDLKTKLRLFEAIVISTTIYAADTWKNTSTIAKKLDVFQQRCLRKILHVRWEDRVRNETVLQRANTIKLSTRISCRRLQLAGHVFRMEGNIPARQAIIWQPPGRRSRGRPKKTWRATVIEDLRQCGSNWFQAPRLAKNRNKWNKIVARCRQAGGTR